MRRPEIVLAFSVLVVFALAACRQAPTDMSATSSAPATSATTSTTPPQASARPQVARVDDASKVCMVNDQYMGKEQIPVRVGDKTYFGCCAMCKEKLEKNEAARTALDPVSGARVDKATAVIVRDAANKVYYFESEETMRRFSL